MIDEDEVEEYEELIGEMKRLSRMKKKNKVQILKLMDETRKLRRNWIVKEKPSISEIFEKFPLYKDITLVS